jgi:hypothetical protein
VSRFQVERVEIHRALLQKARRGSRERRGFNEVHVQRRFGLFVTPGSPRSRG